MSVRNELLKDILEQYGGDAFEGGRNVQLREILFTLSGLRFFDLTRNEYLERILFAINAQSASIYVNPSFSGGDDFVAAGDAGVAPNAHTFNFNTVDFTNNRDGSLIINSGEISGRRSLAYDLKANNPGLEVGQTYRIEYIAGTNNQETTLVMSIQNAVDINVVDSSTSIISGLGAVYIEFIPTSPAFEGRVRIGCGPTTNSDARVSISKPKLYKAPSAGTLFIDSDPWIDSEEWRD